MPEEVRKRMHDVLPKEIQVALQCRDLPGARTAGASWCPPVRVRLPMSSEWVCVARHPDLPLHPRTVSEHPAQHPVLLSKATVIPTSPLLAAAGARTASVACIRLGILNNYFGGTHLQMQGVRVLALAPARSILVSRLQRTPSIHVHGTGSGWQGRLPAIGSELGEPLVSSSSAAAALSRFAAYLASRLGGSGESEVSSGSLVAAGAPHRL